jgi:hypothetical protein
VVAGLPWMLFLLNEQYCYLTHPYNVEKREAWEKLGAAIEGIIEAAPAATRVRKRPSDAFRPKVIAAKAALPA